MPSLWKNAAGKIYGCESWVIILQGLLLIAILINNIMFYVYKISNTINNKVYVGKTNNPDKRWREHLTSCASGVNYKLYRAMRKYGPENFKMEILEGDLNESHILDILEPQYIRSFDSYNNGYNENLGGRGVLTGIPRTADHANKISKSKKNKPLSEDHKKALRVPKTKTDELVKAHNKKKVTIEVLFNDGIKEISLGMLEFCRKHPDKNYNHSGLYNLLHNRVKKYKDIIGIKIIGH